MKCQENVVADQVNPLMLSMMQGESFYVTPVTNAARKGLVAIAAMC